MDLKEYQAKELLRTFSLPSAPFYIARSLEEIDTLIDNHNLSACVIKAQVLAGGRGKAGGIALSHSKADTRALASKILGMQLITPQTGPLGVIVDEVMLALPVDIKKEYYLSIMLERKKGAFTILASQEGGVSIEETAVQFPEKILAIDIESKYSLRGFHIDRIIRFLGLDKSANSLITSLIDAFFSLDCLLLEINPLVMTTSNELTLLDAKMTVDDNALFRQPKVVAYQAQQELTAIEKLAKQNDLSYIALDGNIGCMVNGAGLAMATMDLIRYFGGHPANFLDVGGGANLEKITAGFEILLSEPHVRAILVNIFGGWFVSSSFKDVIKGAPGCSYGRNKCSCGKKNFTRIAASSHYSLIA